MSTIISTIYRSSINHISIMSGTVRLHDGVTAFRRLPVWLPSDILMPQRCLGSRLDCPFEVSKDTPKNLHRGINGTRPAISPRRPLEDFQTPETASKRRNMFQDVPKMLPRGLQETPRCFQQASRKPPSPIFGSCRLPF